jgi:RimJ/RimL family protein N-acetyltransferase
VLLYNQKSIALHERAGFIKEGLLKKHVFKAGIYRDVVLYSLFRGQWNKEG